METGRDCPPSFGQGDHRPSVQDSEAEEVVELQADSVHCPLEASLGVKERVPFGREDGQVLDIPPRQHGAIACE